MFEIRDRDGWTGVEAETLDDARFACTVIVDEGYELPLSIFPTGEHFAIETMTGRDERGAAIWQTSDAARTFDPKRRAA